MVSNLNNRDISQIICPQYDEKFNKSALMKISQVLGTVYYVDCGRVFWNGAFREWSNQVFVSL